MHDSALGILGVSVAEDFTVVEDSPMFLESICFSFKITRALHKDSLLLSIGFLSIALMDLVFDGAGSR